MSSRGANTLSLAEARRIALAAQGFARKRPARVTARQVERTVGDLGLLQIDSVNVLCRSHFLPLFARLGSYDTGLLERLAYKKPRRLFEYWGHEASLLPIELQPLFRWRMEGARRGEDVYGGLVRWAQANATFVERVHAEIRERGALGASELSEAGKASGSWWGWSEGKHAVEWLFWCGHLTTCHRRNFERVYDVPERAHPAAVVAIDAPDKADAQRQLLRRSLRALGVASEMSLRDYYRLPVADTKVRLAELVEAGDVVEVALEGQDKPVYLDPAARAPRRIDASALLSPFDSLVFDRRRTEELFGFRYRIELYTPAEKRQFGYYVLPYLFGDRLVARLDLKADRQAGVLRVLGAFAEDGVMAAMVVEPLAAELTLMAEWLGLSGVQIGHRGDLVKPLRAAVR